MKVDMILAYFFNIPGFAFSHILFISLTGWMLRSSRSEDEKRPVAYRKFYVQNEFRCRLDLIVDKQRSGGNGHRTMEMWHENCSIIPKLH